MRSDKIWRYIAGQWIRIPPPPDKHILEIRFVCSGGSGGWNQLIWEYAPAIWGNSQHLKISQKCCLFFSSALKRKKGSNECARNSPPGQRDYLRDPLPVAPLRLWPANILATSTFSRSTDALLAQLHNICSKAYTRSTCCLGTSPCPKPFR